MQILVGYFEVCEKVCNICNISYYQQIARIHRKKGVFKKPFCTVGWKLIAAAPHNHTRIRNFPDPHFSRSKDRIYNSVFIRANTSTQKPYSDMFYAEKKFNFTKVEGQQLARFLNHLLKDKWLHKNFLKHLAAPAEQVCCFRRASMTDSKVV